MVRKIANLTKLAGLVLLAGCAGPAPVTQRVEVPVYVPCVNFDTLDAESSDGRTIMALARDWARWRKYEGELEAVVAGCR
jgi:uncharacterized lipoprotein YajG